MLVLNIGIIAAICILNYFYQKHGFAFDLKCICSGLFTMLGLINLVFAWLTKKKNIRFHVGMFGGLVFAFLGDVLIGTDFLIGAAAFGIGHICFIVAYCFQQKFCVRDLYWSILIFTGSVLVLLYCPFLFFRAPSYERICIAYAFIISCMLGKAISNFLKQKTVLTALLGLAGMLFFFSDLMLLFAWFSRRFPWANHACMGTYYPALCLLALSMYVKTTERV